MASPRTVVLHILFEAEELVAMFQCVSRGIEDAVHSCEGWQCQWRSIVNLFRSQARSLHGVRAGLHIQK